MLLLLLSTAFAYSTGKTGNSTTGCGMCHGATASAAVTAGFTASTTVAPGEVVPVSFSVTSSEVLHVAAGLDVSASAGTLGAGVDTALSAGEITHLAATSLSSGTVTFDLTWTAPSEEGTYVLHGAGNAVDHTGTAKNDGWALAPDLTITVDDGCDDLDGDGFENCDGDCDDGDPLIMPAAIERCDGVDDDCDGVTDLDAVADTTPFHLDRDGDGFGDPAREIAACEAPAGYVLDASDCEDDAPDVHPGAPEIWYDSVDQDCDGNDTDRDGDGFFIGEDCDDEEATAHPGGTDAWYDGVDGDCDGWSDYDADGDGHDAADWGGADCDDADPAISPEATEVWYDGVDQDCDGGDADQDGDGVARADDCDDLDATVITCEAPEEPGGCATAPAGAWLGGVALWMLRRRRR